MKKDMPIKCFKEITYLYDYEKKKKDIALITW